MEKTARQAVVYYPIDSLVTAQIQYLVAAKASVNKVALLNNTESKLSFTPQDTTQWMQELDIFREINKINKPVNQGLYLLEDNIPDTKSNLKIRSIIGTADLPVAYLKIYYQGTLNSVRRVESKYTEQNSMYKGTRYLVMEFEDINNKSVLTYYSIYGGQKMFLGDSVQYTVNASVSLPN